MGHRDLRPQNQQRFRPERWTRGGWIYFEPSVHKMKKDKRKVSEVSNVTQLDGIPFYEKAHSEKKCRLRMTGSVSAVSFRALIYLKV
jgi:hypothetical protein